MAFPAGVNVGSQNSQDQYAGYGTGFNNPDRFVLDMKERVHLLSPSASPFLSWATMVRKTPCHNTVFSWMEDELFTHRDFKAKIKAASLSGGATIYYLQLLSGADWQAVEAAAKADTYTDNKPTITMTMTGFTAADGTVPKNWTFSPQHAALVHGPISRKFVSSDDSGAVSSDYFLNTIVLYEDDTADVYGGVNGEIAAIASADFDEDEWVAADWAGCIANNGGNVTIHTTTPDEKLQGYAQGSGLPNETRKVSRSFHNYTQIFKTPYSIANTLKAVKLYGGPELARLRLRKAIQHKTELERAIIFQGGGEEGAVGGWGEIPTNTENPLTRFQGLGVGQSQANAGIIKTKNGEWNNDFRFDTSSPSVASINSLCEAIFDDTVDSPSSTKIVFASNKWMLALSSYAADKTSVAYTFGNWSRSENAIGLKINEFTSPVGNLRFVPMPLFRGRYEDYALVVDMPNIEMRPLKGRDTQLFSNVGTDEVDGQLDYFMTETGFEARHESTHAILKLGADL
jgi:hypothetical protein